MIKCWNWELLNAKRKHLTLNGVHCQQVSNMMSRWNVTLKAVLRSVFTCSSWWRSSLLWLSSGLSPAQVKMLQTFEMWPLFIDYFPTFSSVKPAQVCRRSVWQLPFKVVVPLSHLVLFICTALLSYVLTNCTSAATSSSRRVHRPPCVRPSVQCCDTDNCNAATLPCKYTWLRRHQHFIVLFL